VSVYNGGSYIRKTLYPGEYLVFCYPGSNQGDRCVPEDEEPGRVCMNLKPTKVTVCSGDNCSTVFDCGNEITIHYCTPVTDRYPDLFKPKLIVDQDFTDELTAFADWHGCGNTAETYCDIYCYRVIDFDENEEAYYAGVRFALVPTIQVLIDGELYDLQLE